MEAVRDPERAELAYAAGMLHHSELTARVSEPALHRVRHYLMTAAGVRLEQPAGLVIAPPSSLDFENAQHWLERAAEERRGDASLLRAVMDHLARLQYATRRRELEDRQRESQQRH